MREIRVSPDGDKVAIRGNAAADAPNAWGYFDAVNGGGWVPLTEVADWTVVDV